MFCIPTVPKGEKQRKDGEGVVLRKDVFDHPLLNTCLPDKTRKRDDL